MNVVIVKEKDIKNNIFNPKAEYFSDVEALRHFLLENGPCEIGVEVPMFLCVNPVMRNKDFYLIILDDDDAEGDKK